MKHKHLSQHIGNKKGLRPLPEDKRDFIHHEVFGSMDTSVLPLYYRTTNEIFIKDQKNTDFCVACAVSGVSEDQEGVRLSFEFQFAKIKEILGHWKDWGADLRVGCKSAVKFGSLQERDSEIDLKTFGRDFCANWNNWNVRYDLLAKPHKKKSFFKVKEHTGKDLYDSLKIALWQNRHYRRSIVSGVLWRDSWTSSETIPTGYENEGTPHAFKIMGWDKRGLICQLSNGKNIGDTGLFYMPRMVANKELKYGNFMFVDIDPDVAKELHRYNKIIAYLIAYIKKLKRKLKKII